MNCCIECFHDAQIRDMIRSNNEIGNCSFCGKEGVPIYSLDKQSDLSDLISEVINVYEEFDEGIPLFDVLVNDILTFSWVLLKLVFAVTTAASVILSVFPPPHIV